jgi:hypothetical protein
MPEQKATVRLADATYLFPVNYITEATWIKTYLKNKYSTESALVFNGIRKDIYTNDGRALAPREPDRIRVLVEGPVDVVFKNVPRTIELCRRSDVDEIWLLTISDVSEFEGVDKVFSRVPIKETAKIYRSCDVLVKLSYIEGMFGPPLEMFHCGGTAIVYDVTGHDEYIRHDENALVAKTDDEYSVIEYLNRMKQNNSYLNKLKKGACETARKWYDWEAASEAFEKSLLQFVGIPACSQASIKHLSQYMQDSYQYELQCHKYGLITNIDEFNLATWYKAYEIIKTRPILRRAMSILLIAAKGLYNLLKRKK